MFKTEWTTVGLDKRTVERIRELLPRLYGYKSVSDFVQVAVRRHLELEYARAEIRERKDE